MQDSAKYLIHATVSANGVVERSDVVGAIFGQTEGLLGDDLDLRMLQESSKVGRIDVDVHTEQGQSRGEITIASGLDRVETAILAASLESIDRVGPCRADVEVTHLEDVRTAKRREIIDRAEELLTAFEAEAVTSEELIEEVRRRVRVDHITEYEGMPAGPRVTDSDAIVVVEGRADVLTLLEYGIKNAIAVEGTDVPESIAALTRDRTVTAFLDGDRGGDLILKELAQVGSVDHVAFAPEGRSVEDLSRSEVTGALREKVPYEAVADRDIPPAQPDRSNGPDADRTTANSAGTTTGSDQQADDQAEEPAGDRTVETDEEGPADASGEAAAEPAAGDTSTSSAKMAVAESGSAEIDAEQAESDQESGAADSVTANGTGSDTQPAVAAATAEESAVASAETLDDHVTAVIGDGADAVRLLDESLATLAEAPAAEAFEAVRGADPVPATVVLDGEITQRLLDVAAQRGVSRIVGVSAGEFVKQPTSVRISTVGED